MHDCLGCPTPRRIWRVAIHPVLGDIDIETAQIDGAKLVQRVVNLVEFARFISRSAISDYLVQTLQNPAINEGCSRWYCLYPTVVRARGYRKIIKVPQQNA